MTRPIEEVIIERVEDLDDVARAYLAELRPNDAQAVVVGLSGDLGSGKTALTKAFARVSGITDEITSPTFVIEKRYAFPSRSPFRTLVHIDAYRLDGGRELTPLRFRETLRDPGNLILIEWPELVRDALPPETPLLIFTVLDGNSRKITKGVLSSFLGG